MAEVRHTIYRQWESGCEMGGDVAPKTGARGVRALPAMRRAVGSSIGERVRYQRTTRPDRQPATERQISGPSHHIVRRYPHQRRMMRPVTLVARQRAHNAIDGIRQVGRSMARNPRPFQHDLDPLLQPPRRFRLFRPDRCGTGTTAKAVVSKGTATPAQMQPFTTSLGSNTRATTGRLIGSPTAVCGAGAACPP